MSGNGDTAASRSSTLASGYSDGDDQKKLTMLKKAVIALTKQKQELEATNDVLTSKLAQLGGALSEAHETENQLRQEVEQLREALKVSQTKSSTSAVAVASTLKGLFTSHSATTASAAANISPVLTARHQPPRSSSPSAATPEFNDAQEQLLHVNESMHMQIFEMKASHVAAMKAAKELEASLRSDIRKLEDANTLFSKQRADTEREVELLSGEIDGLKASLVFAHTFLYLEQSPSPSSPPEIKVVEHIHKAEVPSSITHAAARRMTFVVGSVERVASAVGGIVAATKGLWEERATMGSHGSPEARRLRNLVAALANKPSELLAPLKTLSDMCNKEVCDHSHFTHVQIACMQPMQEWLSTLLPFLHLCVEGSIPLASRTSKYQIPNSVLRYLGGNEGQLVADDGATSSQHHRSTSVLRDVAVDALTRGLRHHIASRESILRTVQVLMSRRLNRQLHTHTIPSSAPSSCLLFLDTLQHATVLNSCGESLHDARASLSVCLQLWASLVIEPRVKRCIEELVNDVARLSVIWSHPSGDQDGTLVDAMASSKKSNVLSSRADTEEDTRYLTALLQHADQSCLMYFTQCQHAIGELCARNQQLDRLNSFNAELKSMLVEKDEELRSTREAYELQLRVLSDTLTAADAGTPRRE
ncbi:Hypothetical protein, putative [Bodo saltans]|uniref:Uncharacterized protein n=1 Tax=Bodo saltans TaxID=75058 RepID=A0A0S4IKE2_BODSA|nr:Hypothetical protein, putative [Bodo saltans]|eukprot:CUF06383.1 Hypothetical protein, putative [Bodo saltans]